MVDINLLREENGNDPQIVRDSQRKRGKDVQVVDTIIDLDRQWRKSLHELNQLRKEQNDLGKLIGEKKKKKKKTLLK